MFDVYFVNCFLACTIAFFAGYYLASRAHARRMAAMVAALAQGARLYGMRAPANDTDNDSNARMH